jgi:Arc/MetJ-type ribon-helix-helix transcriptional regulator
VTSRTVGFAIADEDRPRLDHLVERFGNGNRSEFLRAAMDLMSAAERAQRLRDLQAYGAGRLAATGRSLADVPAIVAEVLNRPA